MENILEDYFSSTEGGIGVHRAGNGDRGGRDL